MVHFFGGNMTIDTIPLTTLLAAHSFYNDGPDGQYDDIAMLCIMAEILRRRAMEQRLSNAAAE